jgi:phenylalanyl-tRNA synthetase beta chain
MKVPLSWLREYVDLDGVSAGDLAEKLTFSGTEVAGIRVVGSDYANMVVGEVLRVEKHPGADRLTLCRVSDGTRDYPVVCGAPNVQAGQKTAFARLGAQLADGTKLKRAKIRGEVSEGMLCAGDELGLSDDHTGILVLDPAVRTGTPLQEILPPRETIVEIEITWNRPDCLSLIGMAREVAALLGRPLRKPAIELAGVEAPVESFAGVSVEDPQGCPRYTARVLRDVQIGPSPMWMQQRLSACGVRPINNVVDVTNYVMLECGQPLHAFDYDRLAEHRIVVRRARPGEVMATLDGQERKLDGEMTVIADARAAVALGGVMGGAGSEISDGTRHVLLESACFDPARIHRTSLAVGLATESSRRYERGVDPDGVEWASRRAAALMAAYAGARVAKGVVDVYPGRAEPRRIRLRFDRARSLLGMPIPGDEMVAWLDRLQIPVEGRDAEGCVAVAPSFRPDLEIEADLIEEVARLHGLDRVPDRMPEAKVVPDADDRPTQAAMAVRNRLTGLGLTEILNYSFTSKALLDAVDAADGEARVVLPNPVSADYAVMRPSLIPQLIETLGRNLARQNARAAVFEMGRVYRRAADGRPCESERVAIGLLGRAGRLGPDGKKPVRSDEMFGWIKGVVESLLAAPGAVLVFETVAHPAMEEGAAVAVRADGVSVGVLGLAAARIRHTWRMAEPVGIAELDTAALLARCFRVPQLKSVAAFPATTRDVALVADRSIPHAQVESVMRRSGPPELTGIELFDIYEGEGIGAGRRSMAYSLEYRSPERTLTDDEANAMHETVKQALRRELGVDVREG